MYSSTMAPTSIAWLFFFTLLLLLLPAQHGASSHPSYVVGSRQIFFNTPGKSSGNSQQASTVPPPTTCSSSIATGPGNNKKLPVVHRQCPCSPLHGLPSLKPADVLRRDTSRIRRRFSSQSSSVPSPATSINITVNGTADPLIPGALDYSVLVGYGTPEQRFPVFLDTSGAPSQLWCKPCTASGSGACAPPAFDPSRSSTFTQVPCGLPDCPANCSGSSSAVFPLIDPYFATTILGTFSQDVLTVAPSMAVNAFRFVCLDVQRPPDELPEVGTVDLSRARSSLPSRLSSSSPPAFSYCLPQSPSSEGFLSLSIDGGTVVRDDDDDLAAAVHAPLVSNEGNPSLASMYFIGEALPIPADAFGKNGVGLDVGTTFSLLSPAAYAPLRDAFRKAMSPYNCSVPGFAGFYTCYDFTGLPFLYIPVVELDFGNGESLVVDEDQMLYYDDPAAAPFTLACLAFSASGNGDGGGEAFSVIGNYQLASTEVVYDVAGGKVGFIPTSC